MNKRKNVTDRQPSWLGPYGPADFSDINTDKENDMTKVFIEMNYDQIDEIMREELMSTLERNLMEYYSKVNVCDTRKQHRKLIESLHHTLAYYMEHDSFMKYMDGLKWPKKCKRKKNDWV